MTNTDEKPNTTYQCPHCGCYIVIPNNDYYDYINDEWVVGGYFDGWCSCGEYIFAAPETEEETEEVRTEKRGDKITATIYRFKHLGKNYRVEHYCTLVFATWRVFEVAETEQELFPTQALFRTLILKANEFGLPATHKPPHKVRRNLATNELLDSLADHNA